MRVTSIDGTVQGPTGLHLMQLLLQVTVHELGTLCHRSLPPLVRGGRVGEGGGG